MLLTVDGFQVPVIAGLLFELVGKLGAGAPEQNGVIGVKVGMTDGFITTFVVPAGLEQLPEVTTTL